MLTLHFMVRRYPKTLSSGENNTVIAISETEDGKLFSGDTRSDIGSEAEKMKFANNVNNLAVKFIRLDIDESSNSDMLVMERLYPMDFRAYEVGKRELWFDVFEDELKELHKVGFIHGHIKRSDNLSQMYDNVFQTNKGFKLIDTGRSVLKNSVSESQFKRNLNIELEDVKEFKEYFLSR